MLKGKELGEAIKRAIELKIANGSVRSKTEIARHFGIKPPSIHDWMKKGSIGKEKLPELWRYFSDVVGPEHWGMRAITGTTDTGYGLEASQIGTPIIAWDKPEDLPEGEFVIVPRFDIHVACGNGHVVYEEMPMEQGAAFRSDWVKREGLYLRNLATVRAIGDSMEPSIYPGDALLVDRAQTQIQDGRVFLLRFGDEVRVKRLFKRADGGVRIVSDNAGKYPEEVVTAAEMEHIEIIGRVVHKSGAM